jgi:hypothetical protein
MENKNYKKANLTKVFFTLFFGLTTALSFGQADPPPPEVVPLDNNITLMFGIAILFAGYFFIRNYKTILTQNLNILKKTTLNKTVAISAFLMLFATSSNAQNAATWGNVYVHDNGQMHVFTTDFNFMTQIAPAAGTKTSRTASTYGKISFADAVVVNATNVATETDQHYIDGYFRKYGTTAIVFPIGQSNIYGPAKITPTTADGVDGAYYRANPTTIGATIDSGISALDTAEYWHILRAAGSASNAKISLSWSSTSGSNIASLTTSSLTDLTIAAYDGSKWITIPSVFDSNSVITGTSTSLTAGSITSISSNIDLSSYKFFTLAAKSACLPLVASSGNTKTWNGSSWSPNAPTISDPAIISGAYSGNLSCNSLVLNADITLADGELVEVVYGISGTGTIRMSSEASLVQRDNTLAGTANIELTKKSRGVMHWRDYMYYGTPIAGNFYSQIASNTWNTGFSGTLGSFDLNFNYLVPTGWNPLPAGGILTNPAVQTNAAFAIVTGKGFISRIKQNAPWVAGTSTTTPLNTGEVNFKFAGVANSGNIVVPVTSNATKMELLANPYPSGVDAQKFLVGNTNLVGSIYLWTAGTLRTCSGGSCYYAGADYAQWNLAGAVNTSPIGLKPDGKIASAQGFRARVTSGTNITWTNCMRITTGNNNFFRSANRTTASVDRFNLNIQDNNDKAIYNQILVAYLPEATNGFDRLYDGEKYSTSPTQLYTILPDNTKLGINGRETFVDSDVVPMGLSNATAEQEFTISIENKEGVFEGNGVYVYIHDKLNNVYHDMATPFVFNTNNQTAINDRFEIVYQRNTLHSTDYLANEVLINIKNNTISATTIEVGMSEIEIFDITGRKIQTFEVNNEKSMAEPFNHAEGIYIAKVKLTNGSVATQKLINKK